jgi:hypothetical protein
MPSTNTGAPRNRNAIRFRLPHPDRSDPRRTLFDAQDRVQGQVPEIGADLKDTERIDWFLEEVIVPESGALIAFHYAFARYKAWRRNYDLLKTELTEKKFATRVRARGIKTDFERKLFFDVRTVARPIEFIEFESGSPLDEKTSVLDGICSCPPREVAPF